MFESPAVALPQIKSGKLRGLGVGGRTRFKSAPEYAPLHEAGVPGYEATQWIGMLAPARVPKTIIDHLQRASAVALQRPEFLAQLTADGSEPVGSTAEEFGKNLRIELEKWRKVIKDAGIRVE
jgi:tripartite-type tricarboxylate transporter receptor subunit TctC